MKNIKYKSTRSKNDDFVLSAKEALLKGIADDGGLFVPVEFPNNVFDLSELKRLSELNYKDLAFEVLKVFLPDFTKEEIKYCVDSAYDSGFDEVSIAPVTKAGGTYFLELFHGRTLAFKDMALSILPYLMLVSQKEFGKTKKILIPTATSGDTGKAAMEGFRDANDITVCVFYPNGGVAKMQELQMRTQDSKNCIVCSVNGNFDDCQNAVKAIFADKEFAKLLEENDISLSAANSINIGRLIPQVVYYFYAYFQIMTSRDFTLNDKINVSVPTGNFGNILAGFYAKKMGLPIETLICASNENKVLCDFFETGVYDKNRELVLTSSPSMDILVSSNLERLLYHLQNEDTTRLMELLKTNGKYEFAKDLLHKNGFVGKYTSDLKSLEVIKDFNEEYGYVLDPHTAVAYNALMEFNQQNTDGQLPSLVVSTASPYKFSQTVCDAIFGKNDCDLSDIEYANLIAEELLEDVPIAISQLCEKEILHNDNCDKEDILKFLNNKLGV